MEREKATETEGGGRWNSEEKENKDRRECVRKVREMGVRVGGRERETELDQTAQLQTVKAERSLVTPLCARWRAQLTATWPEKEKINGGERARKLGRAGGGGKEQQESTEVTQWQLRPCSQLLISSGHTFSRIEPGQPQRISLWASHAEESWRTSRRK